MSDCYCDYEQAQFYVSEMRAARKRHNCSECGRMIIEGERYEHVRGKWDGDLGTFKTCPRCLSLREFVKAHVPCFCSGHGNIIEDSIEVARAYAHEAPGLLFGAYRRYAAVKRAPKIVNEGAQG